VLGGSCARICPYDRLCEEECSRCGIDRPIEIGRLQRYAVEQEEAFGMRTLKAPERTNGVKVACIGAGPASLACAAELAKAGYLVTIFEKEEKAGGMLTYGVLPARLPQRVVDHDVAMTAGLGIKFEFGKKVGRDVSLDDLRKKGFKAFFVGAGLWRAKRPDIPGSDLNGVFTAVDFLKKAREAGGVPEIKGKSVVVVGGGDVAVDSAVTAKLAGAEQVVIYYRRTLEEAPANMDEIRYAISIGITVATNFAPSEISGTGRVEYVSFRGRDGKSEAKVAADAVVFAIGQDPEDMSWLTGVKLTEKGTIMTSRNGTTDAEAVFAAGDIVNNGKTAVEAVAAGKGAAFDMMSFLGK
jgi:dihydropyrimidine dehydrogenase (NAD+) subunit PreT